MAKKETAPVKDSWEYRDRMYSLVVGYNPLTYFIPSKHSKGTPLLYWDEEKKTNRELRYATNMASPFKDEQNGEVTLGHIVFRDGTLFVPKSNVGLQKLLSLYHPFRDKVYMEENKAKEAADEYDYLEYELAALNAAKALDIDAAEAILRVEIGSSVNDLSSKEIKRDVLLMARKNPMAFMEILEDDNVELRNIAIKAQEQNLIILSQDQRSFAWGSNGRKLMTIPFDENPYSAMAAWFKTDEGVEVFKTLQKKLK